MSYLNLPAYEWVMKEQYFNFGHQMKHFIKRFEFTIKHIHNNLYRQFTQMILNIFTVLCEILLAFDEISK